MPPVRVGDGGFSFVCPVMQEAIALPLNVAPPGGGRLVRLGQHGGRSAPAIVAHLEDGEAILGGFAAVGHGADDGARWARKPAAHSARFDAASGCPHQGREQGAGVGCPCPPRWGCAWRAASRPRCLLCRVEAGPVCRGRGWPVFSGTAGRRSPSPGHSAGALAARRRNGPPLLVFCRREIHAANSFYFPMCV